MHKEIQSDEKNIRTASADIINYIEKEKGDIGHNTLFDIKLCVEEAVRNAIIHGNKSKRNLLVGISYDINEDKIKITIEDKGEGFDVKSLPDPTDLSNLYRSGGRGVYLMHRLMDNVVYNKKGNSVTMEKKLI